MKVHLVLAEQLVHLFRFYCGTRKNIVSGMRFEQRLYGLAHEFGPHERLEAFTVAELLDIESSSIILTVSDAAYKVWVSLSPNEFPHWQQATESAAIAFQQPSKIA